MRILLVGAGTMSADYAKVLAGLGVDFVTVGRGEQKCSLYEEKTGFAAMRGGAEAYLGKDSEFTHAIIATEPGALPKVAKLVMESRIRNILVEKPGGLDFMGIQAIYDVGKETGASVYLGYNRRLYASVLKAREIIQEDGGVKSFYFEFTEWPHTVRASAASEETIRSWFLCNSTHVIDLALYLGGEPLEICSFSQGHADWTDDKMIYCGCGKTKGGALFSYSANWNAPGRWGVEVLTEKHRLIFRPLEKLQIQQLRTVKIEFDESIDYRLDTDYKPGLYREVAAFLFENEELGFVKTIGQQLKDMDTYSKIAGRRY